MGDDSRVWTPKNLYVQINFNISEIELTVLVKIFAFFKLSVSPLEIMKTLVMSLLSPPSPEQKRRESPFSLFQFYCDFHLSKVDTGSLGSCEQSVCKHTLQLCMFMIPGSAVGPQTLLHSASVLP